MDPIIAELLKYGMAGIFIAYLVYSNYLMRKAYDDLLTKFEGIQERRISERDRTADVLSQSASAQRELADAAEDHMKAVTVFTERVSALCDRIGTLIALSGAGKRGR